MKIDKSFALQQHAKTRIPGLCQLLSKRPDQFSWGVWPGYFSKAEGTRVWDLDGNKYIDMSIGGIGATVLGYADADVDGSVKDAIGRGVASSLNCPEEVELADVLCGLHPWASMARFTRSGGEAMAMAVRIARAHIRRNKVAFCGYHGWHDWYLAANLGTENALGEHLLSGLNPAGAPAGLANTAFPFRYNRIDELEKIIREHGEDLAVIVMEPLRSEEPKDEFLQKVRALADKCGAVLIIDEISAGFRLNTGGAHLLFDLEPDIAVFSKALGNGYAIAAAIGKEQYMSSAQDTFISSTNFTERIGFVAALATIEKFGKLDASSHLVAMGSAVQKGWQEIAAANDINIHVGGIKPMSHFTFEYENAMTLKALFVQEMLEKGFLASNMFYAMHAHTQEDVDSYLAAVGDVFAKISGLMKNGKVEEALHGAPSVSGFKRLA